MNNSFSSEFICDESMWFSLSILNIIFVFTYFSGATNLFIMILGYYIILTLAITLPIGFLKYIYDKSS